jgi:hypothetical protein
MEIQTKNLASHENNCTSESEDDKLTGRRFHETVEREAQEDGKTAQKTTHRS